MTLACEDCCRADLSFASCKRALSLQHTIFHVQLCHTQLFTYNLFYTSIFHHLLCLSFLPRVCYNMCCSLLEEVDLWGYPAFNFFKMCFTNGCEGGLGQNALCIIFVMVTVAFPHPPGAVVVVMCMRLAAQCFETSV